MAAPGDMPQRSGAGEPEQLKEITFNASVVLELSAIASINEILREAEAQDCR